MAKFIIAPENELKHYGVKGMKWDKHLKGLAETIDEKRLNSAGVYSDRQIRDIQAGDRYVPTLRKRSDTSKYNEQAAIRKGINEGVMSTGSAEGDRRKKLSSQAKSNRWAAEERKRTEAYRKKQQNTPVKKAARKAKAGSEKLKSLFSF